MRTVRVGDTEVTLLGTAHVSRQSAEDVRAAIAAQDYDAVAVELCQPRYAHLSGEHDWRELDLLQVIRSGRAGMVAAQLALSAYQKRLAEQLDIEPGAEMRAAIDAAHARQLPVWLVDRNVGITLKRLLRTVPGWQRWTLMSGLLSTFLTRSKVEEADIEQLKEGDLLEHTFTEFAQNSPQLYEALVAERDRYMAARLRELIAGEQPERVLVVIGAGHLDGLARQLGETQSDPRTTREALEIVPPAGRFMRWLPWLVVAVILTGFAIGFARGPELGWQLVTEWVLINGTLTAFGAVLALAHPLTVITAFVAAPLTSLNPTIGAGMVTAAVQTAVSPPQMSDFDTVRDQISQLRGWWQNRVARILLVFVFCTLGSAAATYIAGFRIFEQLAL
ncbi:pheromone shutdown-related protein TraB [Methylohalomonas lacus]|uniref:Pheromone shutdown-related protein TraB n=2 Tax=Methylohalomonas lacus TaxID=398773 RepID=A0AAE3L5V3_9GAMM|nr:pheromone shutdown-related protein TraB [Methylohalomonas lacus]